MRKKISKDPSVPITELILKIDMPWYVTRCFYYCFGKCFSKYISYFCRATDISQNSSTNNQLRNDFILCNRFSDSLYPIFYFVWTYIASFLVLKFNDQDNIMPQNMTSAQKNSISTPAFTGLGEGWNSSSIPSPYQLTQQFLTLFFSPWVVFSFISNYAFWPN